MDDLNMMHCIKVTKQTPVITSKDMTQYQAQLPGWKVRIKEGEQRLVKKFAFKDFKQAITFTDKIGALANEEDHHPAILTEWGSVTLVWWTHAVHGLSINDAIMAAKSDKMYTG